MASSLIVSMATTPLLAKATTPNRLGGPINAECIFFFSKPLTLPLRLSSNSKARFEIKAKASSSSLKEKTVTGLTASAVSASMMIQFPEIASAAESASSVSPSLKNFLLSILAGGVVLSAILGAIIAVSNFDPVKRT